MSTVAYGTQTQRHISPVYLNALLANLNARDRLRKMVRADSVSFPLVDSSRLSAYPPPVLGEIHDTSRIAFGGDDRSEVTIHADVVKSCAYFLPAPFPIAPKQ